VPQRDIEKAAVMVNSVRRGRCGRRGEAIGDLARLDTAPAEKASAEAHWRRRRWIWTRPSFAPAVTGRVEQFALGTAMCQSTHAARPGFSFRSGCQRVSWRPVFGQIEAQIMKEGMVAEATLRLQALGDFIRLVVTTVQDYIAAGSSARRAAGRSAEHRQARQILVFLERSTRAASRGDGRQQLHRQRLHQQPRRNLCEGDRHRPQDRLHVVDGRRTGARAAAADPALLLPIKTLVLTGLLMAVGGKRR